MSRPVAALLTTAAAVLATCLAGALAPLGGPAAAAATTRAPAVRPVGAIGSAVQSRTGTVTVTGWAYDRNRPAGSIRICVWSRNRCIRAFTARGVSTALDKSRHISGRHAFRVVLPRRSSGAVVRLRLTDPAHRLIASARVSTPGMRVIAVARRYVGRARYVYGGDSPRGFDCSGYVRYAYQHGRVAVLPHNTQRQRYAHGMHRISRRSARAGDIVFYLSGRHAYHVAIYAGHGMQYAAATLRDGIRYQRVWSSAVEYRTDWH
jgi:cell wall-associated NlpC family hydrolase